MRLPISVRLARRRTRLLHDLLDLSVLEHGKAQLTVSVANLHDLIDRAVAAASNTRPERDFRLERDFPAEHMPIFTDTDRLVQVFINLVSNARKYCDAERAVLRIEVKRRGAWSGDLPRDHGQSGRQHLLSAGAGRCRLPRHPGAAPA